MTVAVKEELAQVREIVLPAWRLLLESLGRTHTIDRKQATEFVTDVDRRVEEMLLAELARHFPGDAVLAEESGDHAGGTGRTWYVDPLDGTTNYAHGYPFFAISVACADAGGLLHGTVCAPYLDEFYQGGAGAGATLERTRTGTITALPRRSATELEQSLLATGFPYRRDETVDLNTRLVRDFLKAPCHGVRRGGSAALDLAHVAAGRLDGYWELNLRPWDTAAGTLLAREAGAIVSDFAGVEGPLHTAHIVAAAPGLHDEMLAVLAGEAPGWSAGRTDESAAGESA